MKMVRTGVAHYDIIGDIHGHATALKGLLNKLGYQDHGGCYCHPERRAIFVGDLIDRGEENFSTLAIVRSMVEANRAVVIMGNHEYNALCFHTKGHDGNYLRCHSPKNLAQHEPVLEEIKRYGLHPWLEYLEWFRRLPLVLDLQGLRVVHACWNQRWVDAVQKNSLPGLPTGIYDGGGRMTDEFLELSVQKDSTAYELIEILLKGAEIPLPQGHPGVYDRDGNLRHHLRLRWWMSGEEWANCKTYDQVVRADREVIDSLVGVPIPPATLELIREHEKECNQGPVFFGHFWFDGFPTLLTATAACLDYSIASDNILACYRWDGETELDPLKFTWV